MRYLISILLAATLALPSQKASAQSSDVSANMATVLGQVREEDWRAADAAAVAVGPVARTLVEWYRLRGGEGTFDEYLSFFEQHPDWPDQDRLRREAENSISPDEQPERILAFFDGDVPDTATGVLRLIGAHRALGHQGDAEALAVMAWRTMPLGADAERTLLGDFGNILADHHVARIDEMLWQGRETTARRMYSRVDEGWQRLAEARLALADQAPGVDTRIEAVPSNLQDDAGLAYERFNWRARKGRGEDAIALLLERSTDPEALGRPEKWANWRRIYARRLMRNGDPLAAYALASRNFLVEGSNYADLEWLSGYLALRYLEDPELALFHFGRFEDAVETPISLGRAGYWKGRAYTDIGDTENAARAYGEGARHQTSFYGLLAAEAAGLPMDPTLTGEEEFPTLEDSPLRDSAVPEAAFLLISGGEPWRAEQFLVDFASGLDREQAGTLGRLLLERGETHIAVRVAKRTARNLVVLPAPYFPTSPLMERELPVERALALAIARRESEFDPVVVSPAGARGLMQLMPGTARDVSADLGISYDRDGLTRNPTYNVTLGSAYLAGLIESFGPAPVLVSVGYNAGPGRAIDWVSARGDPRSADIDIIDWIEHIPFRETRNYVMRVTESVIVYRARLSGQTTAVEMMDYLREG